MPRLGPISRRDLIFFMKKMEFVGPVSGAKHEVMVKQQLRVSIPNPHKGDISVGLLNRILKQAEITKDEWEKL